MAVGGLPGEARGGARRGAALLLGLVLLAAEARADRAQPLLQRLPQAALPLPAPVKRGQKGVQGRLVRKVRPLARLRVLHVDGRALARHVPEELELVAVHAQRVEADGPLGQLPVQGLLLLGVQLRLRLQRLPLLAQLLLLLAQLLPLLPLVLLVLSRQALLLLLHPLAVRQHPFPVVLVPAVHQLLLGDLEPLPFLLLIQVSLVLALPIHLHLHGADVLPLLQHLGLELLKGFLLLPALLLGLPPLLPRRLLARTLLSALLHLVLALLRHKLQALLLPLVNLLVHRPRLNNVVQQKLQQGRVVLPRDGLVLLLLQSLGGGNHRGVHVGLG
mmetsp:Transcript_8720/g.21609  ORF Transcript_8720/g.21609 Transcript_8720/m.21609 type:complete len:331 (-) Transcript_8720:431-1423(-)